MRQRYNRPHQHLQLWQRETRSAIRVPDEGTPFANLQHGPSHQRVTERLVAGPLLVFSVAFPLPNILHQILIPKVGRRCTVVWYNLITRSVEVVGGTQNLSFVIKELCDRLSALHQWHHGWSCQVQRRPINVSKERMCLDVFCIVGKNDVASAVECL
jgi:hypothetical protein